MWGVWEVWEVRKLMERDSSLSEQYWVGCSDSLTQRRSTSCWVSLRSTQPTFLFPTSSCLLPSAFCLLPSASCLLPPASCLLPSASCLLPPASCLLPPASCLLPPQNRYKVSLS
ncbi:MAG: hypothetical protein F6K41_00475 [Symploca sp. SIO3E6]|nr:hypothetical protein [Caldora sp. SIO3E6]